MATLKYLVYVGAGGFAPNFSINYFFKKILTESSRKEYKQEFVTENSKPVRRMAGILRQS